MTAFRVLTVSKFIRFLFPNIESHLLLALEQRLMNFSVFCVSVYFVQKRRFYQHSSSW